MVSPRTSSSEAESPVAAALVRALLGRLRRASVDNDHMVRGVEQVYRDLFEEEMRTDTGSRAVVFLRELCLRAAGHDLVDVDELLVSVDFVFNLPASFVAECQDEMAGASGRNPAPSSSPEVPSAHAAAGSLVTPPSTRKRGADDVDDVLDDDTVARSADKRSRLLKLSQSPTTETRASPSLRKDRPQSESSASSAAVSPAIGGGGPPPTVEQEWEARVLASIAGELHADPEGFAKRYERFGVVADYGPQRRPVRQRLQVEAERRRAVEQQQQQSQQQQQQGTRIDLPSAFGGSYVAAPAERPDRTAQLRALGPLHGATIEPESKHHQLTDRAFATLLRALSRLPEGARLSSFTVCDAFTIRSVANQAGLNSAGQERHGFFVFARVQHVLVPRRASSHQKAMLTVTVTAPCVAAFPHLGEHGGLPTADGAPVKVLFWGDHTDTLDRAVGTDGFDRLQQGQHVDFLSGPLILKHNSYLARDAITAGTLEFASVDAFKKGNSLRPGTGPAILL
jgi:hypothetical protein